MLEEVWTSQQGKVCSLVNWELFSSLQHAQVFTLTLKIRIKVTLYFCVVNYLTLNNNIKIVSINLIITLEYMYLFEKDG